MMTIDTFPQAKLDPSRTTGLILCGMGGPDRPEAVQPFLRNLFADPLIVISFTLPHTSEIKSESGITLLSVSLYNSLNYVVTHVSPIKGMRMGNDDGLFPRGIIH